MWVDPPPRVRPQSDSLEEGLARACPGAVVVDEQDLDETRRRGVPGGGVKFGYE